jgi:hypothetical protein
VAAYGGGFPITVDGEIVGAIGAIGVSGAPTVQNDVDCAKAALALCVNRPHDSVKLTPAFSSALTRNSAAVLLVFQSLSSRFD